jgi:hypothetical protein
MRVRGVLVYCDVSAAPLLALVRRQMIFAVSEICKGAFIFGVGDMATADQFGEVVLIAWEAVQIHGLSPVAHGAGLRGAF